MQSWHNIFELGNGFPTRHGTAVFLAGRKLFADSFLLGMAPLCFLPTGKYLRRVSCSAWHHCVSCRQETFSPGDFSTPLKMTWEAWHHCVSCQQKTVREGFPIRHDITVFLSGRKLFAKGFLLDMALLCFLPAGNYLRKVSYSAWHYCVSSRQETFSPGDFSTPLEMTWEAWQHCVSCQQETICEEFPIRLGITVFLADRKLFANGFLLVMTLLCFLPTGNCLRRVSYST